MYIPILFMITFHDFIEINTKQLFSTEKFKK